jgi:zinc/manganese transport system ATP-binding protein
VERRVTTLVELVDVTLGYGRRPAVHHVDGHIHSGDLVAVAGPNGGGKTTLLKGLARLMRPLDGRLVHRGLKRGDIAYLPQLAELDRSFPIDVWGLVALGAYARTGLFAALGREARARIAEAIAAVGLEGFERRPIASLSGGQLQRALFARTMVQDAKLILLDEPLNAVDARTVERLIERVQSWRAEGRAVVAVLHDDDLIRSHFPATLLLAREPIAWGPTDRVLRPENLLSARRMSETWKEHAAPCRREHAA